ncbi:hypothetical protein AA313_de0201410 [Arthrobotrys entomopaga]|nr:hypothetical protein AA313_de0201410 [Arthrobotrys entomopaga]
MCIILILILIAVAYDHMKADPKTLSNTQHASFQLGDKFQRYYHCTCQAYTPKTQVRTIVKAHVTQHLALHNTGISQQMSTNSRPTSLLPRRQSDYALWRPEYFANPWSYKHRPSLHILLLEYESDLGRTRRSTVLIQYQNAEYISNRGQISRRSAFYSIEKISFRRVTRLGRECASGDTPSSRARNPRGSSQCSGSSPGGRTQRKRSHQSFGDLENDGGSDGGDGSSPKRPKSFESASSQKFRCPFGSTRRNAYRSCYSVQQPDLPRVKLHLKNTHFKGSLPRALKIADNWDKLFKLCIPDWRDDIPSPFFQTTDLACEAAEEVYQPTSFFEQSHSQFELDSGYDTCPVNLPPRTRYETMSDDGSGNAEDTIPPQESFTATDQTDSELLESYCESGDYFPLDAEESASRQRTVTYNEPIEMEDTSLYSHPWIHNPQLSPRAHQIRIDTMDSTYSSNLSIDFPRTQKSYNDGKCQANEKISRKIILYVLKEPESSFPLPLDDCKRFEFSTLGEMARSLTPLFKREFQGAPFSCENWGLMNPVTREVIDVPDVNWSTRTSWWQFLDMNMNEFIELYFCVDTPAWNANDNTEKSTLARIQSGNLWDSSDNYNRNKIIATCVNKFPISDYSMFTDSFKVLSLDNDALYKAFEPTLESESTIESQDIEDSKPKPSADSPPANSEFGSELEHVLSESSASQSESDSFPSSSLPQYVRARSFRKILRTIHSNLECGDNICNLKEFSTRFACPFAKAFPESYIPCLAINCGSLQEVKRHLTHYHQFIDKMEGLQECTSWHDIFDFCFHHAETITRPSPYFSFSPLIHYLRTRTDTEDFIDILTQKLRSQQPSAYQDADFGSPSIIIEPPAEEMDDIFLVDNDELEVSLDDAEDLESLDFLSDQDLSSDAFSNADLSSIGEEIDEEMEFPTPQISERDPLDFTNSVTENQLGISTSDILTPDDYLPDSILGEQEVLWKIKAIYMLSILMILQKVWCKVSEATPDQARDHQSEKLPNQCPCKSRTNEGTNPSSSQNQAPSLLNDSVAEVRGGGMRRKRGDGRRRNNGQGRPDNSGATSRILSLAPKAKYASSISSLKGHIRRDHYNFDVPEEFSGKDVSDWVALFEQCRKLCMPESRRKPVNYTVYVDRRSPNDVFTKYEADMMVMTGGAKFQRSCDIFMNAFYKELSTIGQGPLAMPQQVTTEDGASELNLQSGPMALDQDIFTSGPSSSAGAHPHRSWGNIRNDTQVFTQTDQPMQDQSVGNFTTPLIFNKNTNLLGPPHFDATSPIVNEHLISMGIAPPKHNDGHIPWNTPVSNAYGAGYGTPCMDTANSESTPTGSMNFDPDNASNLLGSNNTNELFHPNLLAFNSIGLSRADGMTTIHSAAAQAGYPSPSTSTPAASANSFPNNFITASAVGGSTPTGATSSHLNGNPTQTRKYKVIVEREEDSSSPELEEPGFKTIEFDSIDEVRANLLERLQAHFTHPLFNWKTWKLKVVGQNKSFRSAAEVADRFLYYKESQLVLIVVKL